MNIFDTVLYPIKWVISAILVAFHTGWTAIGFNPSDGLTWVLSILGLVLVVRAALIPLFVKQIKSQRKMMEVAPQLKKIQEKYKGKRDQFSREAMSRETMELYRRTGTSPLSSCLPLLVQMPIFFSLFSTLNNAQRGNADAGVGLLTTTLAHNFARSELFGAPLSGTIAKPEGSALVVIVAVAMIVLMTASQFVTQLQLMAKNMSDETKASPMYKQQRVLLYFLPLIFIFSGISFPIGVMFYWVFSNLWTMGQQFIVIRNSPTPGSDAARARDARLAARAAARASREGVEAAANAGDAVSGPIIVNGQVVEPGQQPVVRTPRPKTQRTQPVGKARAKRANEGRA